MNELNLCIYNYNFKVTNNDLLHTEVINWLKEDFEFFIKNEDSSHHFSCSMQIDKNFILPKLPLLFSTTTSKVYGWANKKFCIFNKSTYLYESILSHKRITKIKSTSSQDLYEVLRSYILSVSGEFLEKSGWMRLHALGLQQNQKNKVFVIPSKGGKSSLAIKHLNHGNEKIFSDEIVLTNGHFIRPFPICIALSARAAKDLNISTQNMRPFKKLMYEQKYLTPIPLDRIASEDKLTMIYAVNYNMITFLWSTFWGLGLPQMTEYLLRPNNLFGLFKIAFTRIKILFLIFLKGKINFIRSENQSFKIKNLKHSLKNT